MSFTHCCNYYRLQLYSNHDENETVIKLQKEVQLIILIIIIEHYNNNNNDNNNNDNNNNDNKSNNECTKSA